MDPDFFIQFINSFLPGMIAWIISYYLQERTFHNWISLLEILIYSKFCFLFYDLFYMFINFFIKLYDPFINTGLTINFISNFKHITIYIIAVILGFIISHCFQKDLILKFARNIGISRKTTHEDILFTIVTESSKMCYVHLNDGSIIYGYISKASPFTKSFYLKSVFYKRYKGEVINNEWKKEWFYPDLHCEGIYFDNFDNIAYIEFEQP